MLLSDGTIYAGLHALLDPPDPTKINPCSVDIHIGPEIAIEIGPRQMRTIDISDTTAENPYSITPGTFLLAVSYERMMLPPNLYLWALLKSSRAREGWNHAKAFHFDPGWDGVGTLELKNWTQFTTLGIYYRMPMLQVFFGKLDKPAVKPYQGRYQGARGLQLSKG